MKASGLVRGGAKVAFTVADLAFGSFPGPRLLIYHQIGAGLGRQMEVSVDDFRAQLDWLEEHCEIVDLESAIARRADPDAKRLVVLTFDDGYEDMFRDGFPMLRERSLPFVLYLSTHPVESRQALFPGGRAEPVTWEQVTAMAESGLLTLGAHTHTHADLRGMPAEAIEEELATSDALIERRTGIRPTHFAYPWGYWDGRADRLVRRRYTSAVLGSGRPVTGATDPLLLNRVPVQLSDGRAFFRHKVRRGLRLEDKVRRRLTGYRGP